MIKFFSFLKYGAIALIVSVIAGGFWYISGLRADLEVSKQNVNQLENALNDQINVIEQLQKDQEQVRILRNEINDLVRRQNEDVAALRDRFIESPSGQGRDFANIAHSRPGLVENIINNATRNAIRCLEIASGSPIREDEKNDPNPECPSYFTDTNRN